MWMTDDGV